MMKIHSKVAIGENFLNLTYKNVTFNGEILKTFSLRSGLHKVRFNSLIYKIQNKKS